MSAQLRIEAAAQLRIEAVIARLLLRQHTATSNANAGGDGGDGSPMEIGERKFAPNEVNLERLFRVYVANDKSPATTGAG